MSLKDEIRKLIQLQEIDTQVYRLSREKEVIIPAELEKVRDELVRKEENFSVFEKKNKEIQLIKKEKEIDLASREENLKKAQAQLYQLKTNKEYQAKLTEIGSLKADVSLAEEEVIKSFDTIEAANRELAEAREDLKKADDDLKVREAELKQKTHNIETELKKLEERRSTVIRDIDKAVLDKYEKLLKTRHGKALVPIKNNNCGACYMQITPQKLNEIKMYDRLQLCDSCVRILYIPEDY